MKLRGLKWQNSNLKDWVEKKNVIFKGWVLHFGLFIYLFIYLSIPIYLKLKYNYNYKYSNKNIKTTIN